MHLLHPYPFYTNWRRNFDVRYDIKGSLFTLATTFLSFEKQKSVQMNNLSPLGLISCFLFYLVLNGVSVNGTHTIGEPQPYITNHSNNIIYFKPESRRDNPGLDPYSAYPLAPGESYYLPFDAVVTPSIHNGMVYRVPSGSRLLIGRNGAPQPTNIVARAGLLIPAYGEVLSPCIQFDKLANPKGVLLKPADITHVSLR